jgi:hypothetical protein
MYMLTEQRVMMQKTLVVEAPRVVPQSVPDMATATSSPDVLKGIKDNLTLGLSKLTVEAKSWRFWAEPYVVRALAVSGRHHCGILTRHRDCSSPKSVSSRSSPSLAPQGGASTIGAALMLYFNDASICIATCGNPMVPCKLVDTDIANSFHHTFFLGLVDSTQFNRD